MVEYPYSNSIVLTDVIFIAYGGHVGTSLPTQRQAAYLIAEKQMTQEIGTFLLPTTVTGTYAWPINGQAIVTEYGHLRSIESVSVISADNSCSCELSESAGCGFIDSDSYGYIFIRDTEGSVAAQCGCGAGSPYQVRVAYKAGLVSGSSYQADMLLALTMVAEINLNEIIDPGANEGVGDVGITQFSNQSYSEVRKELRNTAFGNSARANKAAQLVRTYRRFRALRFH